MINDIKTHEDLAALPASDMPTLCGEIREFLVKSLSRTGGHLASNLGAVELTVALDRVYNAKRDRIVFDVGHQAYTHKILTGRASEFSTLRQYGGLSGFPKPRESEADAFVAGHASNSVSVALGMARARTLKGERYDIAAVIGDGALTGGLAYEGLSSMGASGEPMVVILNDNAMSISQNVGGIAKLLSTMRVTPGYFNFKRHYRRTIGRVLPLYNILHRVKERIKTAILPDNMFDDMGIYYLGPVDGHDEQAVEIAIRWARDMHMPVLLHVITKKGKGYAFAESEPEKYHGVGKYDPVTGELPQSGESFSSVFGEALCSIAERDKCVAAVTAAMSDGTGLCSFAERFPKRFFDVGIAEGNAIAMSAGMAKQGLVPVAAIYSTFLQRAYDMLFHDVSLLGLHVVLAIDRAGLVGGDGETHNGVLDVAYLSTIPGMEVWCPASFAELRAMLELAVNGCAGPVAIRYPRGGEGTYKDCSTKATGILREGTDVTLVAYGITIGSALEAADILDNEGISAEVIKLGRVCPLDAESLLRSIEKTKRIVVAEEVCAAGCVGEHILALAAGKYAFASALINLGDGLVPQGDASILRHENRLDSEGIALTAKELIK